MKQHFTDEKTGIRYALQGDYYLPDLALPAEEQQPIGIWGQRHLRHIKQATIDEFTSLDKMQFEIAKARIKSKLINDLPSLEHFTNGVDEISMDI